MRNLAGVLGGTLLACTSNAAQPSKSASSDEMPKATTELATPKTNPPKEMLEDVKNSCWIAPPKHGAKFMEGNRFLIAALLDGVEGGRPSQVFLKGECEYQWGDERDFDREAFDPKSWNCTFRTFAAQWPPFEKATDIRGNKSLEGWFGKKPQPIVDMTDKHVVRIDDFKLEGPGQLAINCSDTPTGVDRSLGASCKITWYNRFVPDESHYEGQCATLVKAKPDL